MTYYSDIKACRLAGSAFLTPLVLDTRIGGMEARNRHAGVGLLTYRLNR